MKELIKELKSEYNRMLDAKYPESAALIGEQALRKAITALESAEADNAELKKEVARKADLTRRQRELEAQLQGEVNDLEAENAALRAQVADLEGMVAEINEMTNPDDEESYRGDDSGGCLDTIFAMTKLPTTQKEEA